MLISRSFTVLLMVISSTVFATQGNSSLSNSEALGMGTQNSRALDSNTPNDEALEITNSSNQNHSQNQEHRPGQTVKPTPSDRGNQDFYSDQ